MRNQFIGLYCGVALLAAMPLAAQEATAAAGPEIIEVSPDNQIVNNSRGGVASADSTAGAVESGPGTWQLGEGCTDSSACLHQSISRGGLCGAVESLELVVTNKCPHAVAFGVCAERVDGGWECALHKKIAVGKVQKNAVVACHATGRYSLRGTKATDLARDPACLRAGATGSVVMSGAPAATPAAPAAEAQEEAPTPQGPGACTRAKSCCRALANVEGMRSLDNACAQMNSLDDQNGALVCDQIMLLIQGTITPLPKIPAACR